MSACREGKCGTDDDTATESEAVNVLARLRPFLPDPDSVFHAHSAAAPAAAQDPAAKAAETPVRARTGHAEKGESAAVKAFLGTRPPCEPLHSFAAAVVEELASNPAR